MIILSCSSHGWCLSICAKILYPIEFWLFSLVCVVCYRRYSHRQNIAIILFGIKGCDDNLSETSVQWSLCNLLNESRMFHFDSKILWRFTSTLNNSVPMVNILPRIWTCFYLFYFLFVGHEIQYFVAFSVGNFADKIHEFFSCNWWTHFKWTVHIANTVQRVDDGSFNFQHSSTYGGRGRDTQALIDRERTTFYSLSYIISRTLFRQLIHFTIYNHVY